MTEHIPAVVYTVANSVGLPVTSRCTGLGKRYEAAIRSALTRRAEGWTYFVLENALAGAGVWFNDAGEWSDRAYAITLDSGSPQISVSSASDADEITTFQLEDHDRQELIKRLVEVDTYQAAQADLEKDVTSIVDVDDIHGNTLLWRGLPLSPNGWDTRKHFGCRRGRGRCPECQAHREAGHLVLGIETSASAGYTWLEVTVEGVTRYLGAIDASTGQILDDVLASAGLELRSRPERSVCDTQLAWVEVTDQESLTEALRVQQEQLREREERCRVGTCRRRFVERASVTPPAEEYVLADWELELLGLTAEEASGPHRSKFVSALSAAGDTCEEIALTLGAVRAEIS